jgi:hypothetical protein
MGEETGTNKEEAGMAEGRLRTRLGFGGASMLPTPEPKPDSAAASGS